MVPCAHTSLAQMASRSIQPLSQDSPVCPIDVKNVFTFFYFGHVFYVFKRFFYFPNVFYFLKKRWQSSEPQAD